MPSPEKIELDRANAALSQIATDTTRLGTFVAAIQAKLADLLQQIQDSDNLAEAKTIADNATATSGLLTGAVDALNAMLSQGSGNPTPVPVPEPLPAPVPDNPPV